MFHNILTPRAIAQNTVSVVANRDGTYKTRTVKRVLFEERWEKLSFQLYHRHSQADDPCSVNTAYASESSFTMSPRSTTRP